MDKKAILAPPTNFNQGAAMISHCRLLICNDGGLVHLSVATETSTALHFGQSSLDPGNQKLWVKGQLKNLTFREAKLLNYLIQNANQVLDRERILEAIWHDEGMLVGRSLDVFVSRLRKLLQEDEGIRIVSVHGVGYRFEV